ncbi:MAG TPA: hypothetical protein VFU02_22075 [Polyangiaceae bacterium]|nr:hypothetical protein [Polyangiaceae bacterium]
MTSRALQALERFFEPGAPPSFADDAPSGALSAAPSRLSRNRPGSPDTIRRRFELGQAIVAQSDACSLRDLSKALGGRVSRTFLHRCTTAYRLGRTFPFILESNHLRVSHLDAVERLARPVQGRLLLEADHGSWSVRKLRQRALAERAPSNSSVNIKAARRALTQLRLSLSALAGDEPFPTAATRATLEEICSGLAEARDLSASLLGNQPGLNA